MTKLERIVLASLLVSLFFLVGLRYLLEKSREVHITVGQDLDRDIMGVP